MKKKILSLMMAGALVLSASSVSQAAEDNEIAMNPDTGKYEAAEITVNGEYNAPTIKVELSDTTGKKVVINPYGLKVESITGVAAADQTEKLVNKIETIENKSTDVVLAVNATVSAKTVTTTGSKLKPNIKLATAPLAATDKSNSVFAYLDVEQGTPTTISTAYAEANNNQVVFGTKAATKKNIVYLEKSGTNVKASYKILGDVVADPTIPWTPADKLDFSIVFDFVPMSAIPTP